MKIMRPNEGLRHLVDESDHASQTFCRRNVLSTWRVLSDCDEDRAVECFSVEPDTCDQCLAVLKRRAARRAAERAEF